MPKKHSSMSLIILLERTLLILDTIRINVIFDNWSEIWQFWLLKISRLIWKWHLQIAGLYRRGLFFRSWLPLRLHREGVLRSDSERTSQITSIEYLHVVVVFVWNVRLVAVFMSLRFLLGNSFGMTCEIVLGVDVLDVAELLIIRLKHLIIIYSTEKQNSSSSRV